MNLYFFLLILIVFPFSNVSAREKSRFRVMCYNVENLFDCEDDTLTRDEEYLPGGMRGWSYARYQMKQHHIGKVIVSLGGWEPPAIVGLCEIESRKGLEDLTGNSGMKLLGYKFIHHESPDPRGVDVALLYQPESFRVVEEEAVRIINPESPASRTRDILYVCGVVPAGDSLHVFVCHFPSRLGGELESEHKRSFVASVLRQKVDSLFNSTPGAKIIIMGDFNDYPDDQSMQQVLGAGIPASPYEEKQLYNLTFPLHLAGKGSHKHDGLWGALDQIIVSGALLKENTRLFTRPTDTHYFNADFLLEDDLKNLGKQPFRTYSGFKYTAGYSDHLPVYVDFWY
jgi:predicted extracellular nuclease